MPWVGRPIDPELRAGIEALVRAEFDQEAAAGFPKLRRIPSTGVTALLDYLESLSAAERGVLFDAQARLSALSFFPAPLIASAHEEIRTTEPALLRRAEILKSPPFAYGLRYVDLRMARMMLMDPVGMAHMKQTRAKPDFVPRDDCPRELVPEPDLERVVTAKAPLLRKLLNQALVPLLGVKSTKLPGGEMIYDGSLRGVPLKVGIIFSNMYGQMHYAVTAKVLERNILAQRMTYELLWGTNTGWDCLTEENAPRSTDLLVELLRILAGFVNRIASLPVGSSEVQG